MVHVLTDVLNKVHRALREGGRLLIVQPDSANGLIELRVDGQPPWRQELPEPTFEYYLEATKVVIESALLQGHYTVLREVVTPVEPNAFHVRSFGSIDEWYAYYAPYCEDIDQVEALVAKMRGVAGSMPHQIDRLRRQYELLLQKQSSLHA